MNSRGVTFWIGAILFLSAAFAMTQLIGNQYPFFACYVILQFIVLAIAWNILGGYAGYVNFGTSAFFGALMVHTAVFLFKVIGAPLPLQIAAAAVVGALMGFALGLLTLRMQGIFFSIATTVLTIVIETAITNWRYARRLRRSRHSDVAAGADRAVPQIMCRCCFSSRRCSWCWRLAISRLHSKFMDRVMACRRLGDDELAAECTGVLTLRLKLLACVISGARRDVRSWRASPRCTCTTRSFVGVRI